MTRLRFATAHEVFESFPAAAGEIKAPPTEDPPPAFMRSLAAGDTPEDALTFCAYALGRREAVWWGCQCIRTVNGIAAGKEDHLLRAAEEWVRDPEDEKRRAALRFGMESDLRTPSVLLALAAGWSGGSISPYEGAAVPPAPHLTAAAVRTAILSALTRVPVKERAQWLRSCVDSGLALMEPDANAAE